MAIDIVAWSLTEIGRADDEELEAIRPGLVASPRTGRDAHRVPFLELDDLVVDLHPPAPAHDHVHLLLLLVRVAVRKAIAGRDTLVAQAGLLELERLGRQAELQVGCAVEPGPDILQVLLEVPERERHGRNPTVVSAGSACRPGNGPRRTARVSGRPPPRTWPPTARRRRPAGRASRRTGAPGSGGDGSRSARTGAAGSSGR